MPGLELIVLGSASGLPEPDRAHAALALRRDRDVWLLDAGEGVCSALLRWKVDPQEIRGIYITHCHPDHCVGIFMILQYLHMKGSHRDIGIYLPAGAVEAFQVFMNQLYLVPGEISPQYSLRPLQTEHHLADDLTLQTFPTKHLQRWDELALPGIETRSYAFRIDSPGRSFFYSGDVKEIADIAGHLREGDLLILEAAHVDFDEVLRVAEGSRIGRILLTHALPGMEQPFKALQISAQKAGLEIILARDGLKIIP